LEAAHNEVTPEDLWKDIKTVLLEAARETIGSVKPQKKKKWISDDTYAVIREKREAKGKDENRYQELKAEVQKKLRVDKQQQLEGMCAELEAVNTKGNSRQVFQIVKSMTRKFQPRPQCIQSATGENLTEAAQIVDRWKGYCEELYQDKEGNRTEQKFWEKEPPPLRSEVARAIRQTASRKATGPDDIPAELFKAGEITLDRMHRICVAIWETGEWPEEWMFCTFIPLPKKGDLKQCENYRTIDSISHDRLWVTMMDMGYPLHLIDLLAKLQETAR